MSDRIQKLETFPGTFAGEVAIMHHAEWLNKTSRSQQEPGGFLKFPCNAAHHSRDAKKSGQYASKAIFFEVEDGIHFFIRPSVGALSPCLSNIRFYFVNGIFNPYSSAIEAATAIANHIGTNIHLIYSKDEGPIDDFVVAIQVAIGKIRTQAVMELARRVARDLNRKKKVVIIAHSRGAAVVQSAIESLRLEEWHGENLAIAALGGFSTPPSTWKVPASTMIVSYQNCTKEIYSSEKIGIYTKEICDMVPVFRNQLGDELNWKDGVKAPFVALSSIEFALRVKKLHVIDSYYKSLSDFIKLYAQNRRVRDPIKRSFKD